MPRWAAMLQAGFPAAICCALLSVLGALPAAAAEPEPRSGVGRVDIRDVDAAGLLSAMADAANVNLVASVPASGRKFSLSTGYTSIDELFGRMGELLDMRIVVLRPNAVGSIVVMFPRCDQREVDRTGAPGRGPVSLHEQDVSLERLFETLQLKASLAPSDAEAFRESRALLHVNGVSRENAVRALAIALGFQAQPKANGEVAVSFSGTPGCRRFDLPSEPLAPQRPRTSSENCPYRVPSDEPDERRCRPLEYFNITSLIPKGYVEWNGRRVAFIETPDRRLHAIWPGDYLGRHYGKVSEVSRDAIGLNEIVQDDGNEWIKVHSDLKYGVAPAPSRAQPMDYLQEGSAQARYNKAVNELFLFTHRVVGVADHCKGVSPETVAAVDEALASWQGRHARALEEVEWHSRAYASRTADDHRVSRSLVMQNARSNAAKKVAEFLDNIGPPGTRSRRGYCEGYSSLLRSQALDPQRQFAAEFKLLGSCEEARTCPNLRDVAAGR